MKKSLISILLVSFFIGSAIAAPAGPLGCLSLANKTWGGTVKFDDKSTKPVKLSIGQVTSYGLGSNRFKFTGTVNGATLSRGFCTDKENGHAINFVQVASPDASFTSQAFDDPTHPSQMHNLEGVWWPTQTWFHSGDLSAP